MLAAFFGITVFTTHSWLSSTSQLGNVVT